MDFLAEATQAEASARVKASLTLVRAFDEDWRAALAFLKARDPKNWSEKLVLEGGESPIKVQTEGLTPAAMKELAKELLAD